MQCYACALWLYMFEFTPLRMYQLPWSDTTTERPQGQSQDTAVSVWGLGRGGGGCLLASCPQHLSWVPTWGFQMVITL